MFDQGQGPALVVVQGLHGRWEWMKPALVQLARSCRTISYSLCGDFGSGERLAPEQGFDNYLRQLDAVLDRLGLATVALCGVSFGGFVALRYAATGRDRVTSLVLASAPGPGWKPNAQQARLAGTSLDVGAGVRGHDADARLAGSAGRLPELVVAAGILRASRSMRSGRPDDPVADGRAHQPGTANGLRRRLREHQSPHARADR